MMLSAAVWNVLPIRKAIMFTTGYDYNPAGVLTKITMPDGRTIDYIPDSLGRVSQVTTTKGGVTAVLASNISYMPFGPLKGLTYGSGMVLGHGFDALYQLSGQDVGQVQNLTYTPDHMGNIKEIADNLDAGRSQSFTYDDLYRLKTASGIYGNISYTYDNVGNRKTKTVNSQIDTYAYKTGTNLLTEITGANPKKFTYDAAGNVVADNIVLPGTGQLAGYTYNGFGQRIKKTAGGATTIYHYDLSGNLIGESDGAGNFTAVYVYMGNMRLAAIIKVGSAEKIFYYINDQLGTPQKMVDDTGAVVWAADYMPFG